MPMIHETHHLSVGKRALVYNFFDSEKDAKEFIERHKHLGNGEAHWGMSYHYRDWHKSMVRPAGTKSHWCGEFGHYKDSEFNQL